MSNNNKNNPWKTIVESYQEQVEEANKKGYADFYQRCTEHYLFKFVPSQLQEVGLTFTPVDIEYDDGYYVFGRGSNSVVNFRVAEAPGWLFGIWYRIEEDTTDIDKITYSCRYDVFAQYEQFIDKFKPSRSTLSLRDLIYDVTPDYVFKDSSFVYNAANMFIFIIKEPALAFCRDQFDWNYNEEYHTREEAEEKMQKMLQREQLTRDFVKSADEQLLNYIKQFWNNNNNVFIRDFGKNISPRYELSFIYPDDNFPNDWPIEERIYHCNYKWFIEEDNEFRITFDKEKLHQFCVGFHELREKLEQEADALHIYYSSEVSSWIRFESVEHHNDWKKHNDENGYNIEDMLIYL